MKSPSMDKKALSFHEGSQGQNRRRNITHALVHPIQSLMPSISPWSPISNNSRNPCAHLHLRHSKEKRKMFPLASSLLIDSLVSCIQGQLLGGATCSFPTLQRDPCLVSCSAVDILKFLIVIPLNLSFVREVQWDNGACIWAEEIHQREYLHGLVLCPYFSTSSPIFTLHQTPKIM